MKTVTTHQILNDLYLIRTTDTQLKYFEALWDVPEGMVYNAYLLKTDEGAVLFDTTKANFTEPFLEALRALIDPAEIKHLVIHHMEPDHSGALPAVLEAIGSDVQVWGHPFTKRLMESLYGITPKNVGGKEMVFLQMPWLHWPETMITYMPEVKVMLSGDIFGGYGIPGHIFDDDEEEVHEFLHLAREYFITVIGHYKDYVVKNFAKLQSEGFQPEWILPAHGLVWRNEPSKIVDAYANWAAGTPSQGKIVVVYSSMYGVVEKAIDLLMDALKGYGFDLEVFRFTDDHHDTVVDILGEIPESEAIVLATATYESGVFPLMEHFVDELMHKAAYEKPVLLLSASGWACMAGKQLQQVLEESVFNLVDAVKVKGVLSSEARQAILDAAEKLNAAMLEHRSSQG